MYETKLKGHDGITVYKPLHFSLDFLGNFPEAGETHAGGGCHWRFFRERIKGSFIFLVEMFHDAATKVCFGVSVFDQHAFNFHEPFWLQATGNIGKHRRSEEISPILESLLIQQHQPDLNVDGSSIPLLLFNTWWCIWRNTVRMP